MDNRDCLLQPISDLWNKHKPIELCHCLTGCQLTLKASILLEKRGIGLELLDFLSFSLKMSVFRWNFWCFLLKILVYFQRKTIYEKCSHNEIHCTHRNQFGYPKAHKLGCLTLIAIP